MKVLLSALACEPGKGSEPEVGYRTMLAVAFQHDVWVLTLSDTLPVLERALEGSPYADRIHLHGIDFGISSEAFDQQTAFEYHRRYDRWQQAAGEVALQLDRAVDFDLVHHVTLSAYWTRTGVAVVPKPLVWGPIGGGVRTPLLLLPKLGARGIAEESVRFLVRRLLGRLPHVRRPQETSAVVLAQNEATAHMWHRRQDIRVVSNGTSVVIDTRPQAPVRRREILFVGRLIPWKSPMLALRAFRHMKEGDAVLVFYGKGQERGRLERAARAWGLANRVRFMGWRPRAEVLEALATSSALVHPAVHEEAGLSVAEALSLGTPAVCLEHGGPPMLAAQWPRTPSILVRPARPRATARRIAAALDHFVSTPAPIPEGPIAPRSSFQGALLRAYDVAMKAAPGVTATGSPVPPLGPAGKITAR
jgi:glycosyltransferase involved in cell wall biosynthesis